MQVLWLVLAGLLLLGAPVLSKRETEGKLLLPLMARAFAQRATRVLPECCAVKFYILRNWHASVVHEKSAVAG